MKLTIELVPRPCWYFNLRSELTTEEWDALRRSTYKRAGYKCEICGSTGDKHPVECHEIWEYNDENKIQTLRGLIALCPMCHSCKHIGRSAMVGKRGECVAHMRMINKWSTEDTEWYIHDTFRIWKERSRHEWTLNLHYLDVLRAEIKGGNHEIQKTGRKFC